MHRDFVPESAVQVGFVLTDGMTTREDSQVMEEMAGELLAANITMYALGVGNDTSKQELDFIAGKFKIYNRFFFLCLNICL